MVTYSTEKRSLHIGAIKQISENGPAYEVIEVPQDDKQFVRIKLLETGEELSYPILQVLTDQNAN